MALPLRPLAAAGAAALLAGVVAGIATVTGMVASAAAASSVQVLSGTTPTTTVFPADTFTVTDAAQLTGRRVALPLPTCNTTTGTSVCDDLALLNRLDGFDVRPRVTVPFSGPIDLASVTPTTLYVLAADGTHLGLTQLVWDPASNVLAGLPVDYLRQGTVAAVVVTDGLRDTGGAAINPCAQAASCPPGVTERRVPFTVMSTTNQLQQIRAALDDGSAYTGSGITEKAVSFAGVAANGTALGSRTVFPATTTAGITRQDQTTTDATKTTDAGPGSVPDSAKNGAAYYAFGSFLSPQFVDDEGVVPDPGGSAVAPAPLGSARLGFTLIVPQATPSTPKPAAGWPVAVYGVGITRSDFDLFLTADNNARLGFATIATNPLGHGYGPASTATVFSAPVGGAPSQTVFRTFGRGHDVDSDGLITNQEGDGPLPLTSVVAGKRVPTAANPKAAQGLAGGLIQTAADNMALVRAVAQGVDVDGDGTNDLAPTGFRYYGLSLGSFYGSMLVGTDPMINTGFFNVGGGVVADVARLGYFRGVVATNLKVNSPSLLNGGPGLSGFTEDMPGRLDPPVVAPRAGAVPIQQYAARVNWASRRGAPEAFTPLFRRYPVPGAPAKKFAWQLAFGDNTVPNPDSGEIIRAGGGFYDRVSYYRNDKTPTYQTDPHGFLEDPRLTGREAGQEQMSTFIASDGATFAQPNSGQPYFETPIANKINLDCLHYPDPQTGTAFAGQQNGADCVDKSATLPTPTPTPSASNGPGSRAITLETGNPQVTAGNTPVLSGAVASGTEGVPNTEVRLYAKAGRETAYQQVATTTTDSAGHYTTRVQPSQITAYVAEVTGGSGPVQSSRLLLRVARRLDITTHGTTPGRVTLRGTMLPREVARVGLGYRDSAGRYTFLAEATVDGSGNWSVSAAAPRGSAAFVVYTPATSTTLRGSRSQQLTVP